jgi:hypothetical protein
MPSNSRPFQRYTTKPGDGRGAGLVPNAKGDAGKKGGANEAPQPIACQSRAKSMNVKTAVNPARNIVTQKVSFIAARAFLRLLTSGQNQLCNKVMISLRTEHPRLDHLAYVLRKRRGGCRRGRW